MKHSFIIIRYITRIYQTRKKFAPSKKADFPNSTHIPARRKTFGFTLLGGQERRQFFTLSAILI
jgi:hypothetical protein